MQKNNRSVLNFFYSCILLLTLNSCFVLKSREVKSLVQHSNCNQQDQYSYLAKDLPQPIRHLNLDTALSNNFSTKSIHVANAIGALGLLEKFLDEKRAYKKDSSLNERLNILELKHQIYGRVNFASLEISAIASEMDCEEERLDQIGTYLKEKEDNVESALTVAAIVTGAAGSIAEGIMATSEKDFGPSEGIVTIVAGVTEVTIGVLALANKRKVEFYHKRNSLKEIWIGKETSSTFPASVWYYLNYHNPDDTSSLSLRDQLVIKWKESELVETKKSKKNNHSMIYFGDGGIYTAEELENRADMYDQLESTTKLMKQDLRDLVIQFNRLNL